MNSPDVVREAIDSLRKSFTEASQMQDVETLRATTKALGHEATLYLERLVDLVDEQLRSTHDQSRDVKALIASLPPRLNRKQQLLVEVLQESIRQDEARSAALVELVNALRKSAPRGGQATATANAKRLEQIRGDIHEFAKQHRHLDDTEIAAKLFNDNKQRRLIFGNGRGNGTRTVKDILKEVLKLPKKTQIRAR